MTATEAATPPNQDRFLVLHLYRRTIVVVADGAGGIGGGESAAQQLIDLIRVAVRTNPDAIHWGALLQYADQLLTSHRHAGETTCIIVECRTTMNQRLVVTGAAVGDSDAWLIADHEIDELLPDRTKKPLLGTGSANIVMFGPRPLSGTLLVGTDGLFKYAKRGQIAKITRRNSPTSDPAQGLVDIVRLPNRSLNDDISVVLVRPTHEHG